MPWDAIRPQAELRAEDADTVSQEEAMPMLEGEAEAEREHPEECYGSLPPSSQ